MLEARLVGDDLDAARLDRERRVDRRALDGLAQLARTRPPRPGRRSRAWSRRRPGGRGARRSASAAASSAFPRTRAGPGPRARSGPGGLRERGRRPSTSTGSMRTGSATGCAALEPRERADDPLALRRSCVELPAGLAGHDLDREPAPDELRLDVALVDRRARARRACSRAPRRRPAPAATISAPKNRACSRLKPRTGPKPSPSRAAVSSAVAQSASTPSVVALIGYCSPPAVKTTGTCATLLEALLQQRPRLALRQPADVDAGDRDAVGDPRRRAGEREADQRRQDGEERQARPAPSARPGARSGPAPTRRGTDVASTRTKSVSVATVLAGICYGLVNVWRASGAGTGRSRAAGSRRCPRRSGAPSRRASTSRPGGRA